MQGEGAERWGRWKSGVEKENEYASGRSADVTMEMAACRQGEHGERELPCGARLASGGVDTSFVAWLRHLSAGTAVGNG
eukprot:1907437-Pyramimonas_sp.AAC.1